MNIYKLIAIAAILLCCTISSKAQTTVVYTINSMDEDATIDDYYPTQNNPNEIEYCTGGWTINGTPVKWRNLIRFNLNCIPSNATVLDARISFYFASLNNFGDTAHSSLTHSNESVIQRITGPWNESSVNWNNQPASTSIDEVIIPQSITGTDDYLNLNVTAMVQQMVATPSSNFGFLVKSTDETPYARMFFASGDNPDSSKHPTLSVTFTIPTINCITLTLDSTAEDASIDDYYPNQNNPNEIEYCTGSWTINGTPVIWRDLFRFPIPCELNNMHIDNASLSLFHATQNNFGNVPHSNLTHSDESVIQRVTGSWTESTIEWNNQPTTTSTDEVIIPQSITGFDDYINLDVTAMVQKMVENPDSSLGFMVKAINETPYARMFFASGDNPDPTKHPRLQICYSTKTGIDETQQAPKLTLFPNPATDRLTIRGDMSSIIGYSILNLIGESVSGKCTDNIDTELTIDLSAIPNGIYVIRLSARRSTANYRIIVNH